MSKLLISSAAGGAVLPDSAATASAGRGSVLKPLALAGAAFVVLSLGLLLHGLVAGQFAAPAALLLTGGFAVVGVFALTAGALGVLRFTRQTPDQQLALGFLESIPWGALVTGPDGEVLYANDAYRALVAGTSEAVSGGPSRPEQAFSAHLSVAPVMYRLSSAARAGRELSEELRLAADDSMRGPSSFQLTSPRWFRITVRPWHGEDADMAGLPADGPLSLWEICDITLERMRHDAALRKLKSTLDNLDNMPVGFLSTGADGRIEYLNKTLSDWLGLETDVVLPGSLSLSEIIAGDGAAMLTRFLPSEGSDKAQIFNIDLIRADGTRFPARLMHQVVTDEHQKLVCSRTLVLRGRSLEERTSDGRAAEMRFARFYHAAPFAIATICPDGRITAANAKFAQLAVAGDGADDGGKDGIVLGQTRLADLVDAPSVEALRGAFAEARQGLSDITPIEVAFGGKRDRLARLYAAPAGSSGETEDEDAAAGEDLIIYALDTTAQKALEEQFAQSQKMQAVGQLAGGIAHDFNNVLTAIVGFSDLLLRNQRHTDPSFQDIMNIKQNAIRAAGLVRQLMAFSRQQTLRPEVLSLNDKLSDLSIWLGRLLGERVDLHVHHGRDLWPVKVDTTQFDQVIMNLAVNARDAMRHGGELTIVTRNVSERESRRLADPGMVPGEYVLCEVTDTGAGMSADVMAKIFDPFFTTKKVGEGTGLGLSTVFGIVKQTGGFVYVDSAPGQGTTFRIYLPRYRAEEEPETPVDDVDEGPDENTRGDGDLTGTETILLVEDEEAVRTFAARALATRGYNVFEASNGLDALEVMDRIGGKVDIVVSDVVMPEMDGPALLKELRKLNPALKIIFMSGYAEDAFKRGLGDEESFNFMGKPFTLKQLAETVKETLAA